MIFRGQLKSKLASIVIDNFSLHQWKRYFFIRIVQSSLIPGLFLLAGNVQNVSSGNDYS